MSISLQQDGSTSKHANKFIISTDSVAALH